MDVERWVVGAALVVVLVVWVARFVAYRQLRHIQHGTHMLMVLEEFETNTERREYLKGGEHRRHKLRCDCGEYPLPFQNTTIIEDITTHAHGLCQPTREAIRGKQ